MTSRVPTVAAVAAAGGPKLLTIPLHKHVKQEKHQWEIFRDYFQPKKVGGSQAHVTIHDFQNAQYYGDIKLGKNDIKLGENS